MCAGAGGAGRAREASSEGSLAEGTPDTDESGGEPRHRNKRRHHAHHELAPPVHVAALEVQNVKRAINRYGTLPKGARIGAYLESMRQSVGGAGAGSAGAGEARR